MVAPVPSQAQHRSPTTSLLTAPNSPDHTVTGAAFVRQVPGQPGCRVKQADSTLIKGRCPLVLSFPAREPVEARICNYIKILKRNRSALLASTSSWILKLSFFFGGIEKLGDSLGYSIALVNFVSLSPHLCVTTTTIPRVNMASRPVSYFLC